MIISLLEDICKSGSILKVLISFITIENAS
jgi:hypothetical protein